MQYFPSPNLQKKSSVLLLSKPHFPFQTATEATHLPAAHAFGWSNLLSFLQGPVFWWAINPSAKTACAAWPSTYFQEPSPILTFTNHLATRLTCLSPYENYNHRVNSASLNLCLDLCPSSSLLYPREDACKEGTLLNTKVEKTIGKPPAKQSMQRTAFSQQKFVRQLARQITPRGKGGSR